MSVGFGAAQTEPIQGEMTARPNQDETAISVVVTDPQGAVIPNARVILQEKATKKRITAATDREGTSRLAVAKPGDYDLEIKSPGFKTFRKSLRIAEHKTERLVVKLKVDGDTVIVGGLVDDSLVDHTTSRVTNPFSGPLLQHFPH